MRLRFFLYLFFVMLSLSVHSQTKRALVIGLGEQQDPAWNKINGDRDVHLVVPMLKSAGYRDITTLVNRQATKSAIVKALNRMVCESRKGDIVYIHFSGHGQRMTDVNGDETDNWDECWIPYDAYRKYGVKDHGEKHLRDDELALILTRLRNNVGKGGDIVVVVDACHSGDSTREFEQGSSTCVRGVFDDFVIPIKAKDKGKPWSEEWLTLSACKNYQLNFEHPKKYGKLTYAICLYQNKIPYMSNQEILEAVSKFMQRKEVRGRYPQSPVMSGNKANYQFRKAFSNKK